MGASSSGVKKDALGISGTASGQAGTAYGTLNPIYTQEATSPTGYTPQEKTNLLTSGQQSTGGSIAGAVGQGDLVAARTNNAGGYAPALDQAAREGMAQNSTNALSVENADAALKEKQRQEGIAGLNDIYNTGTGASIKALDVANSASVPFWKQFLMQGLKSGGDAASAYLSK